MKRHYLTTFVTCMLLIILAFCLNSANQGKRPDGVVKVGFLYENDESTPYTYNFTLAQDALERAYPDQVEILTKSNVLVTETDEPIRDLVRQGCQIIFSCGSSDQFLNLAEQFPEVEFCQASWTDPAGKNFPENYHSFKGAIHEGRYVSGIAAGMKLRELLDKGELSPEDAMAGYVAAFEYPEVISGYTAFLLGIRSVVPEARLRVRYTETWSNFTLEKTAAEQLIADGCVIIAQDTDTIGPSVACEESDRTVYNIGYNMSMMDVAPNTALVSVRINWAPYVLSAVEAVMEGRDIERVVKGSIHGNDVCAGFDRDWVELLELNDTLAAPGTEEELDAAIRGIEKGDIRIFQGDYIGVNPKDPDDIIDLRNGYTECEYSSYPSFHWVLRDVIEIARGEESGTF